jgi:hypothetical protein
MLFIYSYKPIISKLLISLSIFLSVIYTYFYTFNSNIHIITHIADIVTQADYFKDIYVKPWTRAPPYLFGLIFGLIYF